MTGVTRRVLERAQVEALVRGALGSAARPVEARPLAGGTFNACWGVSLSDGRQLVLKVAPAPELPMLHYERDLLRTEVDFYARAAAAGVPVPTVVATDFSRRALGSDFFVMTRIPGAPLSRIRRRLSREALAGVRAELGRAAARLAGVRGECFGYPVTALGTRTSTWRAAYAAMLGHLLRDAERWQVRLPRPAPALEALVAACAPALEIVDTPRLVHYDLWDGNVFVETAGGTARLAGVIDGERAFWGDPLAELASLALFGEIEDDAAFLRGYQEGGAGALAFDDVTRARIALGQLYLYLIMWIEPAPRRTPWPRRTAVRLLTSRALRRLFRRLDALAAVLGG